MTEVLGLREMLDCAIGEVRSQEDFIALHRKKKTRPENWFASAERILQYRRQVVAFLQREVSRRAAEMDKEKAA